MKVEIAERSHERKNSTHTKHIHGRDYTEKTLEFVGG
jgi:hypothetical protein